jgi:hypothetical protein
LRKLESRRRKRGNLEEVKNRSQEKRKLKTCHSAWKDTFQDQDCFGVN